MEFKLTGGVVNIDSADFAATLSGCKRCEVIAESYANLDKVLDKIKDAKGLVVCFKGNKELSEYEAMGAKISEQAKDASMVWAVEQSEDNEVLVIAGW